ncbi:neoverrucotoxin subunit alpha-like [Syngnathus typhle]|uniref:neoverrucotoxin subunit alpha-like n=1 Tax=Syngnathus typhle TaxID=161592 RepID=UPI002A6AE640|nr:neoverrucotoxin subunit alpha-like [Syngnathus typhle]
MSETIKLSALGQPFTLGMLYNACKDELIPGFSLWDKAALESQTSTSTQKSSSFKITASDTIEARSSMLDVEASLSMSFLGGLVEVGGSAKYLNSQKKFKNQSRVTFQYKATTTFKQLSLPALGALTNEQKKIIEDGKATHLVTGILYGANAVFVFDSEKLEASSVQDIQGNMQAVIKKIPTFVIEGSAQIKLSEEEQNLTNKFTCTFFGDLILEKNPANFAQAVETYCELPSLLADLDNNAPVVVWLYPLSALYDKAAVLVKDLSVSLSRKIQQAMEEESEAKMRCNDCLFSSASQNFPVIRKNVSSFQKILSFYKAALQLAMSKKLPLIRDGAEDESSLAKIFDDHESSPFRQEHLQTWLTSKERDINIIESCVNLIMEESNAYVVRTKSELDRVVLSGGVTNVLCYVFTNLDEKDACLDVMSKYLDTFQPGGTSVMYTSFSKDVVVRMRENVQTFLKYAKPLRNSSHIKFLITAMRNDKYKGSSIYHYKDGFLDTDNFTVPVVPPVKTITDRNDVIWHAVKLTLNKDTVNKNLSLSEEDQKVTYGSVRTYPANDDRFIDHPQVLCNEPLSGRHYWEVEWRGHIVAVAAYKNSPKKNLNGFILNFSDMVKNWGMHVSDQFELKIATGVGDITIWNASTAGMLKLGVFLDHPGGTLSFYGVNGKKLKHLYTFEKDFEAPLYPGFAVVDKQSYARLTY